MIQIRRLVTSSKDFFPKCVDCKNFIKHVENNKEYDEETGQESYTSIFRIFIQSILQKMTSVTHENKSLTINTLIKLIVDDCHELSLKMFEDLDKETALHLFFSRDMRLVDQFSGQIELSRQELVSTTIINF